MSMDFQLIDESNSVVVTLTDSTTGRSEEVVVADTARSIQYARQCFAHRLGLATIQVGVAVRPWRKSA